MPIGIPRRAVIALPFIGLPRAARAQPAAKTSLPPTVAKDARLEVAYASDRFFEGPIWDAATARWYVSAFGGPGPQVLRLQGGGRATVWMDASGGMAHTHRSRSGRVLAAQAHRKAIVSFLVGRNGPKDLQTLTQDDGGVPYINPTDVTESPVTGVIYFADANFKGKVRGAVYMLPPGGRPRRVVEQMKLATGVEVSSDGTTLYVSDGVEKRIYAYPILPDGSADQGEVRVFFDPPAESQDNPDGMCLDERGNLYCAMRGGLWVSSPRGELLGFIPIPEFCSNASFGGPDGKTLLITAAKKVYSLRMTVSGRG